MRVPRFPNRGWVALCGLALLMLASPVARAQTPPDTIGTIDQWLLHPEQPCVDDDVVLYVRGFSSTPCDSFIFAGRTGDRQVLVRTLIREGVFCFAAPIPYAIPIHFGTMPAGPQSIALRHQYLVLHPDGTLDSTTFEINVGFSVTSTCEVPVPIPADQLPYVDQVLTSPVHPCPELMTSIHMIGHFNDGCGRLISAGNDNGHLSVVLAPYPPRPMGCPEVLTRWEAFLPLGFLQTGTHQVNIDLTVLGTSATWPPIPDQSYRGNFTFAVTSPCDTLPGGPLPYVNFIRIGPTPPDSAGICAGAPIPFEIGGAFPNDCFSVRGVQLIDMSMSPIPMPPIVRVIVDGGCYGRVCNEGRFPWRSVATLPGLPTGDYNLMVQLAEVSCSDSIPPGNLYSTTVPFQVGPDSCHVTLLPCLSGHWQGEGDARSCDAFIGPGHPAQLTFEIFTNTALSGLQGVLRFREPGLQISTLEAVGPAVGMHLSWIPTPDGARFVLFADQGAPIPGDLSTPSPVLRVTVVPSPVPVPIPAGGGNAFLPTTVFHLAAEELLGSDIGAHEVVDCATQYGAVFLPPTAVICTELGCDFNGDGVADVRDLVLMVRCVNGWGACPPDPVAHFDCDGNGQFALGDVLCCAVHVLRGPCLDCPVDSTRAGSGQAELASPVLTDHGADVSVRLTSPGELGAARLALRFPTDRYRLAGVDLLYGPEWLELHESSETGAILGLIRLQPTVRLDLTPLEAVLHLELLPGRTAGGEVRLESGDFSANDGVKLDLAMGDQAQALGGALELAVSQARPNPTSGETRFAVTLDGDAQIDVGIYDIGGRRIAQLFRGPKGPGSHPFSWNGRAADGSAVGEGIYFYRVTGAGRSVTGKVALLRAK